MKLYQVTLTDGPKKQPSDGNRRPEIPAVDTSIESEPPKERAEKPAVDGRTIQPSTDGISDTGYDGISDTKYYKRRNTRKKRNEENAFRFRKTDIEWR